MDRESLISMELSSFRAWPALDSRFEGGWILRAANGYTGRANSVQPLFPVQDVETSILAAERWYSEKNLPARFRITGIAEPPELDQRLEDRGYLRESESLVQTATLDGPIADERVRLEQAPSQHWLSVYEEGSGRQDRQSCLGLFSRLPYPFVFAGLVTSGRLRGCGLGVIDNDIVWLFDIAVEVESRCLGYGRAIVSTLMAWGAAEGASRAGLQVLASNEPALSVYAKLGFGTMLPYHYRVKALEHINCR